MYFVLRLYLCLWHQLRYNFSHTRVQVMSVQIVCQMRFEEEANVNQNVHTKRGKILPQQHKEKLDKLRCKGWGRQDWGCVLKMPWHMEKGKMGKGKKGKKQRIYISANDDDNQAKCKKCRGSCQNIRNETKCQIAAAQAPN